MYSSDEGMVGPMLRVCTRTWTRDSHDLFDYETLDSKQLAETYFASSHGFLLLRSEFTVSPAVTLSTRDDKGDKEHDYLLNVARNHSGDYTLLPAQRITGRPLNPQRLFLVVRSLPNKRYALQEDDLLKLGRYNLRVRRIVTTSLTDFDLTNLLDGPVPEIDYADVYGTTYQCRICLSEGTDEGRLLCLCECKGSIKYVHIDCMRRWMHLRSLKDMRDTDQPLKVSLISDSACELCKARLPKFIRVRGDLIPLVEIPDMTGPFIILEDNVPSPNKCLFFISVNEPDFVRIGRGHEASVRISDVSISRNHANILYDNGTFYIEDHNSKFGTLVAVRRPIPIRSCENIAFQVGRSLIEFCVDPTIQYIKGIVKIPPVIGRFSFCRDIATHLDSGKPSPAMSNHHNVVDDSMGTSADEQSQRSFVQYDHQNPLSMEFGESVSTFVRSGVPTNYSDSRGLSLGDASHVNGSYLPGEVYFPSFNGSHSEDITPQSPYGHVVDAPSPNSAADGILSLRLILNTPASNHDMNTSSRDHILTNLRYSNHVTSTNRIIPQHDPQCFTPMTRSLGLLDSSVTEDSARHGYYLPDNAFMSVDVPRDITVPEMATNGFQSRRVAASPVTDGSRGMWRCVTVSPASSIHTPK